MFALTAEQALELAATAEYGCCTACGEWQPRSRLVESDGWLFCPPCAASYNNPPTPALQQQMEEGA